MNEKNGEMKKDSRKSALDNGRKPWITPEVRVLPVPGNTQGGFILNAVKPETAVYRPS